MTHKRQTTPLGYIENLDKFDGESVTSGVGTLKSSHFNQI